jgi:hypothetical protein
MANVTLRIFFIEGLLVSLSETPKFSNLFGSNNGRVQLCDQVNVHQRHDLTDFS